MIEINSRLQGIEFAVKSAKINGLYLEFGVFEGKSINVIANIVEPKKVYGFDSFKGLPEDWNRGDTIYKKGHFSLNELPKVNYNVNLVEGFYEDSLAVWKEKYKDDISFIHIDFYRISTRIKFENTFLKSVKRKHCHIF